MPKYDGHCRGIPRAEGEQRVRSGEPATIRLRVPDNDIVVTDLIRGTVTFSGDVISDFVLVRSNGHAGFNFASAVDDHLMRITHVIRGDDHLTNTARQLLIFGEIGAVAPQYAHLSLILGPDGAKLSKRHGATTIGELKEAGYLPEAIVNYLALLSWSHEGREILTLDELIAEFDLAKLSASPVVFDQGKLDWLNHEWIMRSKPEDHVAEVQRRLLPVVQELHLSRSYSVSLRRAEDIAWPLGLAVQPSLVNYGQVPEIARAILQTPRYTNEVLGRISAAETPLRELRSLCAGLPPLRLGPMRADDVIEQAADLLGRYRAVGKDLGLEPREILMPLRLALTGSEHGPELRFVLAALGRDEAVARIDAALAQASCLGAQDEGDAQ